MNAWAVAAILMLLTLPVCAVVCLRGDPVKRLVGLELATVTGTLTLVLLSEAYGRALYLDLALAFALLSFGGGLAFARLLERWL